MKVTTISASVRYSKVLGDGSHNTVELTAEATLTPQEGWQKAQATLYHQLGEQLKGLWTTKANGQPTNGNGCQGRREIVKGGAVVNPGAEDLDKEMRRMEDKVRARAMFIQTQAVYDPEAFEGFMSAARRFNVPDSGRAHRAEVGKNGVKSQRQPLGFPRAEGGRRRDGERQEPPGQERRDPGPDH